MILLWLVLLQVSASASVPERMQEGLTLLKRGDSAGARAVFEAIVAEHPNHGPARLQLGQLAVEDEDWTTAATHLEVAVQSNPQRRFLAWHLLGRVRRAQGDTARAIEAFDAAIALASDFTPARVQRAELAELQDDLWTALDQYRHASHEPSVEAALANVARRMGAFDLARCAAARAGDDGAALYLRAVIEAQAGASEEAIGFAERALALGYENAAIYLTLGDLLHEKMELDRAIEAFERALTLDPAAAESIASFALTSLTTEQYTRLRALLERHVESHPDSLNTLYALGGMYLRDGALDEALAVFEHLAELVPNASQVRYNLSLVLARRGDAERAAEAMERFRALKRAEDERWERENAIEQLRMRRDQAEAPKERRALAEAVLEAGGRETADLLALGEALIALGLDEAARPYLEEALEKSPYQADLLKALGREDELALLQPDCGS